LTTGPEGAERTQVTPVDLDDDADEEERAQATPPSRDAEMSDADEAPQHVYVKEEHLPEWILARIQSQERATLDMEFAILTLIAKTLGLKPPTYGDRLQTKPALDSLQDEFMRLTCGMRTEDKKADVRAQCLEAAISAVKREGRAVVMAAAQQGGAAAVPRVEQPIPADTPSPAATPQGTPRGKAQLPHKGEPKGAGKGKKGKLAPKGKDTAKAQATLKGQDAAKAQATLKGQKGKDSAKAQAPLKGQKGGKSTKAQATSIGGKGPEMAAPPASTERTPIAVQYVWDVLKCRKQQARW